MSLITMDCLSSAVASIPVDCEKLAAYAPIVGGAAISLFALYKLVTSVSSALRAKRFAAEIARQEKDVVHLYVMPRTAKILGISGPCLKIEAALRLAKVPYVLHSGLGLEAMSPSGRVPFAVINGEILTESDFILKKVVELRLGHAAGLDGSLTKEQAALGQALKRMVDGDFSRGLYRGSYVDGIDGVRQQMIQRDFGVPAPISYIIARNLRQSIIKSLNASGFGDLTDAQYVAATLDDARAIEAMIEKHCYFGATGTKKFILGTPQPTSCDAAVFPRLYEALWKADMVGAGSKPFFAFIKASKPINDYVTALKAIAFPDEAEVLAGHKASEQRFVKH